MVAVGSGVGVAIGVGVGVGTGVSLGERLAGREKPLRFGISGEASFCARAAPDSPIMARRGNRKVAGIFILRTHAPYRKN
ncbi:hypothetical protein ASG11_14485 [Sphingomonas sp. Leaf357]|nr:hypothetical protein ASG11_14485 [Sphingomonas sp. Leaf357]